jgi:4-hydroxy-2-oxoglutarate aldolase
MTGEAMLVHFTAVADASPIPIILYNMPAYAGIDMSVETILKLAAHPNIIGLKESSGNIVKIAEMVNLAQTRKLNFTVLAGSASFLLASLAVGASGGVVALANVAPENCLSIYREFQAGNMVAAKQAQQKALAFNAAVTSKYGVAGLKFVMDKIGLYGGPVRPPLLPINVTAQEDITRIMSEVAEQE